jgi:RimJ/RimL family protein N-acetyltransferase
MFSATARHNQARLGFENASTTNQAFFEPFFNSLLEMFTDPEVVKYVCDVVPEDEIRTEMSSWIKRGGDGCIGIWCIADQMSGEKYGSAYLLPMPVEEPDNDFSLVIPGEMPAGDVELGYFLKRSAWSKGYATEVCKRLLEFAF